MFNEAENKHSESYLLSVSSVSNRRKHFITKQVRLTYFEQFPDKKKNNYCSRGFKIRGNAPCPEVAQTA